MHPRLADARPVLIAGQWRQADATGTFQAVDPATRQPLADHYPVSSWADCDAALTAAHRAARKLAAAPTVQRARFLNAFADRIERRREEIVQLAHRETGYPVRPRLDEVELPRTTDQLRQAAAAAEEGSWREATIDTSTGIRSCLAPVGPVCVFGPNNFPLAFGSASGGDFAAAIAAGNPVVAKANTSHPGTTRLLAEAACEAIGQVGLPPACVQLLYRTDHADGERLVSDARLGATAYTGSRTAGLRLKAAADGAGKPIYLELSSVNPVVVLPGALAERCGDIVEQFTTSCLLGTGQFCTNPGLILLLAGEPTERFIAAVAERFEAAPVGTLLSAGVAESLERNVGRLQSAGAEVLAGNAAGGGAGFCFANTLLRVDGASLLRDPAPYQVEAFGNAALLVVADDLAQAVRIVEQLEGNLTGCIYSSTSGDDDAAYDRIASPLAQRVGRLLNDKMPTGVAVSPAMNHGGPYPATGHPGFTAVGIPAALRRFAALRCYDNVRPHRLPPCLQDANPSGRMWRRIDGMWTRGDVPV